jgi:acetoin utilization protein AcuB
MVEAPGGANPMGLSLTIAREMQVADRMSRDVVTIETERSCRWALQVMNAGDVGRLPVLEGGRLVGIVTELDIWRRAPRLATLHDTDAEEVMLGNVNVAGVMSCFPHTVSPASSLAEAVGVMFRHDVSTLPVVDEERLVGILTLRDVLQALGSACGVAADVEAEGEKE